ncbi:Transcription factor ILR3 [Linum grandiflorum]
MHRVKVGPSNVPSSKACREKMRRDRLNDRFLELSAIIDPARPPKSDKSAILADAARMVSQLRGEADKLKETNASLQEKITELKAEKSELRDEKQRLKTEKEQLERQVKAISCPPPGSMAAKLMPFVGYPQVSMWQFMPPAAVDTSQDHAIRPPVA